MAWAVGQRLQAGKYTIEAVLGEGGFGITFLARDAVWNPVVIKTLNDTVQYHPRFEQLQQDFVNEALWLAKCTHPHIVQVHRVFQEGGQWCMVMEYIPGDNLAHRVKSRGVLSEPEALWYIRQIGEALMLMHQNGLLHRDVKPENIMVRAEKPEAVLLDLGIAREFVPDSMQNHTAIISNGYAPIEQYEYQAKRGAFSDVYGLAATLYSLLTGKTPTDATIRAFNLQRHGHDPVEPAKQVNPQVSERTNQAIIEGMAIEWQDRPQTIEAWLNLLPTTIPPAPVSSMGMGNNVTTNGMTTNGNSATMPPPASSVPHTSIQPQSVMVTLPLSAPAPEPAPKRSLQINLPALSDSKSPLVWIGLGLGLAALMAVTGFGVSRWLLEQRAEAKLAQLKQLDAAGDYQTCLTKAATISNAQPIYEEAQAFMNACAAGLIDQAKGFADNAQYKEALQAVIQIPPKSRVGEEAQDLANQWSEEVRQQAEKLYAEQGKLNQAIELLRVIPDPSEAGNNVESRVSVEQTIAEWQKAWAQNEKTLQEAKQALEAEDWYTAADKANALTTPYWQAQANSLRQEAEAQIAAAEEEQQQQEAAAEEERKKQQEVAYTEAQDRCRTSDGTDWRSDCQEFEQLCEAQGGSFVADADYVGCHTGAEGEKLPPQPDKPAKIDGLPPEQSGNSSNNELNSPIDAPPPPVIPRLDR